MMDNLVKVVENDGKEFVSARELHKVIGGKYNFKTWSDKFLLDNDFYTDGVDYFTVYTQLSDNQDLVKDFKVMSINELHKLDGNQLRAKGLQRDYNITTDMAKELCMLSQTKEGKVVREWFIRRDKTLKDITTHNNHILEDTYLKTFNPNTIGSTINMMRALLDDGGINKVKEGIDYILSIGSKQNPHKAYMLKIFKPNYKKLIEEQSGTFGAKNSLAIVEVEKEIAEFSKEYARRSGSRINYVKTTKNRELISRISELEQAVQEAKDNVENKVFLCTGTFTKVGSTLLIDDEHLQTSLTVTRARSGHVYSSGELIFKAWGVKVFVTGHSSMKNLQAKLYGNEKYFADIVFSGSKYTATVVERRNY